MNMSIVNDEKARRLTAIIEAYDFNSLEVQIAAPTETLQIRIGFVGEFSSGKSTLINSILGEELLPSRSAPTTANIIQIEADATIAAPEYFVVDPKGDLQGIGANDFESLAVGTAQGMLRLCVPPRGLLQPGMQLIDSPGINALVEGHAEITLAQLAHLDGIVVCLHCEFGTVPSNVINFLKRDEIQRISHKLIFALTAADQKAPASVERIVGEVSNALVRVMPNGAHPNLIITRALDSLGGDQTGMTEFFRGFKTAFIARIDALRVERRAQQLKHCAELVQSALRAYQESLTFSDDDLEKHLSERQNELDSLRQEKLAQERRLEHWYQSFRHELQRVAESFSSVLARAEPAQLEQTFMQLQHALHEAAVTHIRRHAPELDVQAKALPQELQASAQC